MVRWRVVPMFALIFAATGAIVGFLIGDATTAAVLAAFALVVGVTGLLIGIRRRTR
jgi:hypothetical protein